mmetsp:Transcript_19957/g.44022  ORF Transcript_19957/g.44022 Transcript_19957/m.44022 type:complete len:201 (-) Transcript_19957:376-978(-)
MSVAEMCRRKLFVDGFSRHLFVRALGLPRLQMHNGFLTWNHHAGTIYFHFSQIRSRLVLTILSMPKSNSIRLKKTQMVGARSLHQSRKRVSIAQIKVSLSSHAGIHKSTFFEAPGGHSSMQLRTTRIVFRDDAQVGSLLKVQFRVLRGHQGVFHKPAIVDDTDLQRVTVVRGRGADIVHSQVEPCLLRQVWHFHHIWVHE